MQLQIELDGHAWLEPRHVRITEQGDRGAFLAIGTAPWAKPHGSQPLPGHHRLTGIHAQAEQHAAAGGEHRLAVALGLQLCPRGTELSELGLQLLNRVVVAQVEVLGSHPQRAVAGNHLITAQRFQGLELQTHRLVGHTQGADARLDRLGLAIEGLDLIEQGVAIRAHATSPGGLLIHPTDAHQQVALLHLLAHAAQQLLHLAGGSRVDPHTAFRRQQHRTAFHLHSDGRRESPSRAQRRNGGHGQQLGDAIAHHRHLAQRSGSCTLRLRYRQLAT